MVAAFGNVESASTWADSPRGRKSAPAPRPRIADTLATLAGVGFGAIVAFVIAGDSMGYLKSSGDWWIALGRLCAMTGAYLLLIMVVLIARIPWLERTVGQNQLVRWHRSIGPWAITLIALHITMVTIGYSEVNHAGIVKQFGIFIAHYPDLLASLVGFSLLVMAGVSSARIVRDRMRYETWWIVHLYMYLGLALAFFHQIRVGVLFLGDSLARTIWITAWAGAALVIILCRVALPVRTNSRHHLRVDSVVKVAPTVHSVVIRGRHLADLAVAGGQFFQWRFLAPGLWWHSHPYSLSALPQPPFLRLTVKGVGDQSRALAHLKPGTRVFMEGPYGAFTHHVRAHDHVLMIGAGVGVTPLRALLEDFPDSIQVNVIIRVSKPSDVLHFEEFESLVARHHGQLHILAGPRHGVRFDGHSLRQLAPEIDKSDVYVCGPPAFSDYVVAMATELGVDNERIHRELFAF